MNCPRCEGPMHEITVAGIPVDICYGCYGTWYDAGELSELLEVQPMELHVSPLAPAMLAHGESAPDGPLLPCPRCQEPMERFAYLQKSEVVVDGCAEHGIWLDNGELDKIIHFVQNQPPLPTSTPQAAPLKKSLARTLLGLFYDFGDH